IACDDSLEILRAAALHALAVVLRYAPGKSASQKRIARIMRAILLTALSGRAGVRAMKGPCGSDGGRRRYDAASPEPMYQVGTDGLSRTATPPDTHHYRPTFVDAPPVRPRKGGLSVYPSHPHELRRSHPAAVRAAPCRMSDS